MLSKLSRSLSTRGLLGTVRYGLNCLGAMIRWYLDSWYDRRWNVDTSGKIVLSDLKIDSSNVGAATWYEPVPNSCFVQLMEKLAITFEGYVFIDYGSGEGRVLFLAANYSFKRIIGVEFSRDLHNVAEKNIQTYRNPRQRCFHLESVCQDATEYVLPPEPSVLFFYSPFNAELFTRVIERVKNSLATSPRDLYILFVGLMPELIEVLRTAGLNFQEIQLRRDHLRGESKRGFILHHAGSTLPSVGGAGNGRSV